MEKNMEIRKELLQSVSGLSDEQLNELVKQDSWAIMQVLHHLYLIEISVTQIISSQLVKVRKRMLKKSLFNERRIVQQKLKHHHFQFPQQISLL